MQDHSLLIAPQQTKPTLRQTKPQRLDLWLYLPDGSFFVELILSESPLTATGVPPNISSLRRSDPL